MIARNPSFILPKPQFATVLSTRVETIPLMTDPMGKHWKQPDLTDLDVSGDTVELTQAQFDGLLEYSTSVPTGVYAGKCWKAEHLEWEERGVRRTGIWHLRWFGESTIGPGFCSNHQRIIKFINPRKDAP